jgi:proteasomal ATPase-associated factor 1
MTRFMNKPITLPVATIQHDFQSVIIDVREGTVPFEDFWISCYRPDCPSVHGQVRVELDESDRTKVQLKSRDGVEIQGQVYQDSTLFLHN